jgi:hypothetical protein
MRSGIYVLRVETRQSAARFNTYTTFDIIEPPFALLCSGIQMKHPQISLENGSVHIRAKM